MNQDYIVFLIITATIGYTVYSLVKGLRTKKVKSGCGGCNACELSKFDRGCH